jgi:hypothetical protein
VPSAGLAVSPGGSVTPLKFFPSRSASEPNQAMLSSQPSTAAHTYRTSGAITQRCAAGQHQQLVIERRTGPARRVQRADVRGGRQLAQPVGVLFLRQIQRRVRRVHIGRPRRPVGDPSHRDLPEHRRQRPGVTRLRPGAGHAVRKLRST